ncbi:cytochrome c3 family protein [Campylobacter sputorum]|uniref:cytochrome c3 family protein n=1 Tax=Campylobacter sputorum TaxID=206 RepID=UPI000B77B170|nr:NapC/NirT family cytochrome c [Campylobacter sputorum]ASM37253.1 NapC/NirT cytochrome c family protein [Campylobacter sputorum bv. faecalis CCUG 20703]
MKKKIFYFILIGLIIGVMGSYTTTIALTKTSSDKFCVVCHEMDPMVASYRHDVHGGKGDLGFKAQCVDCHLPHDSLVNYIYTKAKNGVVEGYIHFFKDVDQINWLENRKNRLRFVFDDGCVKCHQNIYENSKLSPKGLEMHAHYRKVKLGGKEIGCTSCHLEVGHKNLRSVLNYYAKEPEYEIYKDKPKMLEEKDKIVKELSEQK